MLRYSGYRIVPIVSSEQSERGEGLGGRWGELQVYLMDASRELEGCFEDYGVGLEVPRGQGFRGWVITHKRLFRRQMISDHFSVPRPAVDPI